MQHFHVDTEIMILKHWHAVCVHACVQWAVVGDTFPVGCRFQNAIVFRDNSFTDNPDERNPLYKSVLPIYTEMIESTNRFKTLLTSLRVTCVSFWPFKHWIRDLQTKLRPRERHHVVGPRWWEMHLGSKWNESISQVKKVNQQWILHLAVFQSTSTKSWSSTSAPSQRRWGSQKLRNGGKLLRLKLAWMHHVGGVATNWELLSLQGMYMIRFHSFYPWHSHSNYMNLCNDKDLQMLPWVQEFKWAFLSQSLC